MITVPIAAHDAAGVVALLADHTYDEVERLTGWSKGRIWRAAVERRARKTETRIRERGEERRRRQEETLRAIIGDTVTADVMDFFDSLPDDSLDLIVTSVPYNIGKPYGGAPQSDHMRHLRYHGWMMQVISEMARALKPDAVAFVQLGNTRDDLDQTVPLDVLFYDAFRRAGLTFQNRVIWTKNHGLQPKGRLAERYETALVWCKGDTPRFNATAARTPQLHPGKRSFKGAHAGELSCHPLGAWPSDVWDIGQIKHNHPERTGHPAQYPLALAKRAVNLYSLPGELVCDPFSGSGTTAAACVEAGRAFVGADLFYSDLRRQRLAAVVPDTVTALPGVSEDNLAVWQAEARRRDIGVTPLMLTPIPPQ
ncbi:site-specific DNA-methyltransferase [bacterium]|nr:MAG: site-specific DNA-methyltransferase [bacterium]